MRQWSIYTLSDPQTGEVRYVGQSVEPKSRLAFHLWTARKGHHLHKDRWIKKLLDVGLSPTMIIIDSASSKDHDEVEKRWIAHFKSTGARLTNLSIGGGAPMAGRKHTPETITKMKAWKRPLASDETRRRLSESHKGKLGHTKGRKASPELRHKLSVAHIGQKPWNTGKKLSPELCAKMSQSRKGKPVPHLSDPAVREKSLAGMRRTQSTLEFRSKRSDIIRDWQAKKKALGTSTCGVACGSHKLTDSDIMQIRISALSESYAAISSRFSVAIGTISAICRGLTWQHIGGPIKPTQDRKDIARMGAKALWEKEGARAVASKRITRQQRGYHGQLTANTLALEIKSAASKAA